MVEFLCHEVPAKCHYRPPGAGARAVFRTVFSVAFTVRFVTFSDLVLEILSRYVPLSPAKSHYRPPGPAPHAGFGTVFTVRLAPLSASSQNYAAFRATRSP